MNGAEYRREKPEPRRKRRGGRPELDEAQRRSKRIGVPVNREEEAAISSRAKIYHMTNAFFLRYLGLNRRLPRPIPSINYIAHRDLGRMAANLNQLIMLINSGRQVEISREFAQRLYDLLQSVRRSLLKEDVDDRQGNQRQ
ncbi:MAG: hypothetical protein WCF57_03705 [Pyrinomonadaceae bacterium]